MSEMDSDLINPEEWTTKELVKHIYRELQKIETDVKQIKGDVSDLKTERVQRKEREKIASRNRTIMFVIIGFLISICTLAVDALIGLFAK